jgi:hypothetical protein
MFTVAGGGQSEGDARFARFATDAYLNEVRRLVEV